MFININEDNLRYIILSQEYFEAITKPSNLFSCITWGPWLIWVCTFGMKFYLAGLLSGPVSPWQGRRDPELPRALSGVFLKVQLKNHKKRCMALEPAQWCRMFAHQKLTALFFVSGKSGVSWAHNPRQVWRVDPLHPSWQQVRLEREAKGVRGRGASARRVVAGTLRRDVGKDEVWSLAQAFF